jgi:acyl-coenzyme A synthetase/AMP-(fatty) acid ligase
MQDLKQKLQRYMLPNTIKQLEAMPLTATGKINRVLLKENYLKERKN